MSMGGRPVSSEILDMNPSAKNPSVSGARGIKGSGLWGSVEGDGGERDSNTFMCGGRKKGMKD